MSLLIDDFRDGASDCPDWTPDPTILDEVADEKALIGLHQYIENRVANPEYHQASRCAMTIAPALTDTAHSAPLGCTFYSGAAFPAEYRGDYFVCYHGSWNRSRPTGYRVVRVRVQGGKPRRIEHFVDGFLPEGREPIGRPVDVLTAPDGSLLVSDDFGGRIFRVHWVGGASR